MPLVADAVIPVVAQVVGYKGKHPGADGSSVHTPQRIVLLDRIKDRAANTNKHQFAGGAQGTQKQAGDTVIESVGIAPPQQAVAQLNSNGAIALMLILANFVGVAAYTYFADLISTTFDNTDRQTQVFAWVDFATNALSFIGQLLLVKHSVRKFGIGATLALLPIASAIGFALIAFHPAYAAMAVFQVVRRSLTFGFAKPVSDMLYTVVTPEESSQCRPYRLS